MAQHYFARPELHNNDDGDYDQLHAAMANIGYYRVMQLKDGYWYDLPTGEYYKNSSNATLIEERLAVVDVILSLINTSEKPKDYSLVLTRSFTMEVCLKLRRTTDPNKLAPGTKLSF